MGQLLSCGDQGDKLAATQAAIEVAKDDAAVAKEKSDELERKLQRSKEKLERLRKERDEMMAARICSPVSEGADEDSSPRNAAPSSRISPPRAVRRESNAEIVTYAGLGSPKMLSSPKQQQQKQPPQIPVATPGPVPGTPFSIIPGSTQAVADDGRHAATALSAVAGATPVPSRQLFSGDIAISINGSTTNGSSSSSSSGSGSNGNGHASTAMRQALADLAGADCRGLPHIRANEMLLWQLFCFYTVHGDRIEKDPPSSSGSSSGSGAVRKITLSTAPLDPKAIVTAAMLKGGPEPAKFDVALLRVEDMLQMLAHFAVQQKTHADLATLLAAFQRRETITYTEYVAVLVAAAVALAGATGTPSQDRDKAVRGLFYEMDLSEAVYHLQSTQALEGPDDLQFVLLDQQ
jgi:hypothetical protein